MLASSHGTHAQTLASATDLQPAWNSPCAPSILSNQDFQELQLQETSRSQVSPDWGAETRLRVAETRGNDAAINDLASLPDGTAHTSACPSRLEWQSDRSSTNTNSELSQALSHSGSSNSIMLGSALHEASPRAWGQLAEPHEPAKASGLSCDAAVSMQDAQEPRDLSSESPEESMPSPATSASFQHGKCNRQLLSTAQQVCSNSPVPPVGAVTADSGRAASVRPSSGQQKQWAGSAVQGTGHHRQQDAQRQCSEDSDRPSGCSAGAAVEYPAQVG